MKSENKILYDTATRLTLYVEDLKAGQANHFDRVLREMDKEIKTVFYKIEYKSLDEMSKTKLNKLISELRNALREVYSKHLDDFTKNLEEFVKTDSEVNIIVWASLLAALNKKASKVEILSYENSVNYIKNNANKKVDLQNILKSVETAPLPANGVYPDAFVKNFTVSAQSSIENTIRKAWTNKLTVEETLRQLVGDTGKLREMRNQSNALTHTILSHAASIVSASVLSCFFDKYVWNSVIDSRTTAICRSRNKTVYTFGEGPLPPAHINCRSSIAPIISESDVFKTGFYSWLIDQPDEFQNDILGEEKAELLRNGTLKSDDFSRYETYKPLTFEEFRNKIRKILTVNSVN